jgi:ABC-type glycerol-3-phosphate transport system permease component
MSDGRAELHTLEKKVQSVALHIVLILIAFTMIVPFWWMVSTSLTENANTEVSNPPRWTPYRTQNRLAPDQAGSAILAPAESDTVGLAKLRDGDAKAVWISNTIPPGGRAEIIIDAGSLAFLSRFKLVSPGREGAHLYPDIEVAFAPDKADMPWEDTRILPQGAKRTEGAYELKVILEPRIRARFVRLGLVNTTSDSLPVALSEIEAIEELKPSLQNYEAVLTISDQDREIYGSVGRFGRYYLNSFFVSAILTLTNLFFCSLAGYAFAKGRFQGRNVLFYVLIATMMVPGQVTMIPVYAMMQKMGLLNSLWALILPGITGAYGVFLCTQFIRQLPDSLLEAARLDGCSEFRIYYEVVLPLSKPVLATLGIVTFLGNWNNFIWPLIVLNQEKWKTLPLGLITYRSQYTAEWGNMMAASAISLIPILIVFVLLQKYVITGMAHAGMKE